MIKMNFMYCPSCGKDIAQNLNFCSSCGKVLAATSNLHSAKLAGLIWSIPLAVGVITLGGFGMLLYFRLDLVGDGTSITTMGSLMVAIFSGVLVIDWILLRQLSRFINIFHPSAHIAKRKLSDRFEKPPQSEVESGTKASHLTGQPTRLLKMSAARVKDS